MDQFSNRKHERCITLSRPYSLSPDGFTSFHLPLGVLFSFHSRYYFSIGLGECLGLRVCASYLHARFPTHATLCTRTHPRLTTTGLSPSMVPRSSGLCVVDGRVYLGTTFPLGLPKGFGLPCSAFNRLYSRNRYCFLFLCLLRCFNSAGYLSLMRVS